MENSFNKPLVEASRVSTTERIIFTDKTPKSLFEYFINGYTEKDIQVLIDNLRMDFEVWDKTFNFYKSSNTIAQLSSDDISVLYIDESNNSFIYSFETKRIYYYDEAKPPYIKLEEGMSILEFLLFAKRDFEALLRTPYGKKYVTESTIITEGIKEFFGFGKALRIFIDQRDKNDNERYAFDEHTYACIDSLIHYQKDMISESDYRKILGRKTTLLQVFENRKLGHRTLFRAMEVENIRPAEETILSFGDIVKRFDQSEEKIYFSYKKAKSLEIAVKASKKLIEKWLKKNSLIDKAMISDLSIIDEFEEMAITVCTPYKRNAIIEFDTGIFTREYLNNISNKFQRLKDSDIHQKFLSFIDQLINILNSCDKTKTWVFKAVFDISSNEAYRNESSICEIVPYEYNNINLKDRFVYIPSVEKRATTVNIESIVNNDLFTYFTGRDLETYRQDLIKESCKIPHTKDDAYTDISLESFMFDENNDPVYFDPSMEATMVLLFEADDRSLGRKIIHGVKDGVESVKKAVSSAVRFTKDLTDPVGRTFKNFIDGIKKDNDETEREIAITGSTFLKLRQFLKNYVLPAAIIKGMISPWVFYIGAISFIIKKVSSDKDTSARDKVIRELEVELKMVREKIDDAKSDNNREAKYKLMRMESDLENEISRIKYNTK